MGFIVRGLVLSVSGFLGMALCLNYASTADLPYLVPIGLVSVLMGGLGFVLMVSGLNREMKSPTSVAEHGVDLTSGRLDRQIIKDGIDLGRLDEPSAKI